ncbi:VanW family protein [Bacillus sp. V5-8f]|uniref:VanW family protein n=1 Tax=Bacillus sp. V5-8f TaxID=2053044 RepID=UPI000C75AC9F|nr:VanW family protein [Bacillus sp. V5-8f]PLT35804.1 vancomycin resistance protein [Bacillus sp. V5-8f]
MKKGILLLMSGAVAGGLVLLGSIGGTATGSAEDGHHGIKHYKKELSLSAKQFTEPELALIDSRNGKELQKIKASSLKTAEDAEKIAEEFEAKYDRPMIPAKLVGGSQLKPGQSRIVVNSEALTKELESVNAFQRSVEVPISEEVPNISAEAAADVDQAVLGRFTTTFNSSVAGRTTNIRLSANEINNIVLGPGDRFYFNLVVGERTAAKGYQKAKEIVNKEFVEGIGGGICQTSTTLYNAVEKAGLGIIELHHHSKTVGYVPKDRDATVSWGGKDFKFQNTKNHPVIIKAMVQGGSITVEIRAAAKHVPNH